MREGERSGAAEVGEVRRNIGSNRERMGGK